jgi:hypothetical protein
VSRAVNPKTVVDNISDLSLPAPTFDTASGVTAPKSQYITVKFRAGHTGLLDMSLPRTKVWHEVIASMRQSNNPVYVEIDAETNIITELLIPLRVKVGNMVPSKENRKDVEVELIISQAVHHLRHTNPMFSKLEKQLKIAKQRGVEVLVTERSDDHEIIDVRKSSDSSDSDVVYNKSKDPSGKS